MQKQEVQLLLQSLQRMKPDSCCNEVTMKPDSCCNEVTWHNLLLVYKTHIRECDLYIK